MANYNKVILVGNLTRDPQMSYLPSQTPVVEFGLAVNRRYKDQSGQQREETCFIDCKSFGKSAEILNQYMSKGRPILVEGRLHLDTWEAQDGSKRSKHRVIVEQFQFLGGGGGGGAPQGGTRGAPQRSQAPNQEPDYGGEQYSPDETPGGEDIPF
ncbi:MAG: single-stranded DNA-binding protein [Phycisphaerae bacterium]